MHPGKKNSEKKKTTVIRWFFPFQTNALKARPPNTGKNAPLSVGKTPGHAETVVRRGQSIPLNHRQPIYLLIILITETCLYLIAHEDHIYETNTTH